MNNMIGRISNQDFREPVLDIRRYAVSGRTQVAVGQRIQKLRLWQLELISECCHAALYSLHRRATVVRHKLTHNRRNPEAPQVPRSIQRVETRLCHLLGITDVMQPCRDLDQVRLIPHHARQRSCASRNALCVSPTARQLVFE
jgi:hypothetical protein